MAWNVFQKVEYAEEVNRRITGDFNTDVFDGMEGELTQAHIDAGRINNCRECPVALALNDMLAEHKDKIGQSLKVEVNRLYVFIMTETRRKTVLVAEISGLLDEWVHNYDDGEKLPPGKLYIEKDGFIEGLDGETVQHWNVGIDVPDAYYIDPIGFEDNRVDWGI